MLNFRELSGRLNEFLRLSTYPVAVKLYERAEDLEKATVRRPEAKVAICQLFAQARYIGRVLGGTLSDVDICVFGTTALGFTEYPDDVREGKRMLGIYHATEEGGKKVFSEIPRFKLGTYSALIAAPLHRTPVTPDVVLFYGNPAQILRLIHGYVWRTGERLTFSCSGEGTCADAVVTPMKTGKPSLAIPCNGIRILSIVQDSELIMGVPTMLLDPILEGMDATHKGGIRYPPTFQMTYLTPQPPVSDVIGRAPKKS